MTNRISLDDRLATLVSYVNTNDVVADIGTDHGLVPIFLLVNKIAKYVYATDIAKGPLDSARKNALEFGIVENIEFIQTNGINNLPLNIDKVIIAGMGGHLISEIITTSNYETLLLSPNTHPEVVREKLQLIGYKIVDEKVVFSKKKYYQIIKAIKGQMHLNDKEILYGPINLKKMDKTFISYLLDKKESLNKIELKTDDVKKTIQTIDEIINGVNI